MAPPYTRGALSEECLRLNARRGRARQGGGPRDIGSICSTGNMRNAKSKAIECARPNQCTMAPGSRALGQSAMRGGHGTSKLDSPWDAPRSMHSSTSASPCPTAIHAMVSQKGRVWHGECSQERHGTLRAHEQSLLLPPHTLRTVHRDGALCTSSGAVGSTARAT